MWSEFFRFDLRYQLRQPMLWMVTLVLMLMGWFSASSDAIRIGGATGAVYLNAPVIIANQLGILSVLALFLVTMLIAGSVLRDAESGMSDLLYATPMRKSAYLLGRFLAGWLCCLLVFALVALTMLAASAIGGADPERLGPVSLWPYVWSMVVLVLPNLLFVTALLMLLAALTRSLLMVYVGVLAFMVLWSAAGLLAQRQEGLLPGSLLDPFALRALAHATRYYTNADINQRLPEFAGALLANRLLWALVALSLLALTVWRFQPLHAGTARRGWLGRMADRWFRVPGRPQAAKAVEQPSGAWVRRAPHWGLSSAWRQCWSMLTLDVRGMLRSLPFMIMLLLGLANFLVNYLVGGLRIDSVPYPLTRMMLQELDGGLNAVLGLVLLFYSGELVHKDRQARIDGLSDAMPVAQWAPLLAKCGALLVLVLVYMVAGVPAAMLIQAVQGGVDFQPLLYLQGTLLAAAWYGLMALALLALQVLAGHRYLGYALGWALMLSERVLQGMGIDNHLYSYAALPALVYSDMNGYGHYLKGWSWFAFYWTLFALALLLLAQAFWQRGQMPRWRQRWRLALAPNGALRGLRGAALLVCLAAWAACGRWIDYNTSVLNLYLSPAERLDLRADYEKTWRSTLAIAQPRLVSIQTEVELFPQQQRAEIRGHYLVQNKESAAMDTLHLQRSSGADGGMVSRVDTQFLNLPPHTVLRDDKRHGVLLLRLARPIAPGEQLALDFKVSISHPGFTNSGKPAPINDNGTLFTFDEFFPQLGYQAAREIDDRNARRTRGLGEPHRSPARTEQAAVQDNYLKPLGVQADLVAFDAIVSTSADQTAMAPGSLQRQWRQQGRNYFHYKLARPALPFLSFQSARWNVRSAEWQGMPIRVYYHPQHPYNVERMLAGARAALAYNSRHFGPYPYDELRILETPLYQSYARSFPMTIPISESLGFINDVRDPERFDHVFYVTAHEVAHHWWGEQVMAAHMQGGALITESLSEYAALMATEQQYGKTALSRLLRWNLDEYLRGRGADHSGEVALAAVDEQVYLQYRKGSLAFYRLRAELGEQAVNVALRRLLEAHRYQPAPYVTSMDLLAQLRAQSPPERQQLLTDLFERIVLYDNRIVAASVRQRADGRWEVPLKLRLAKLVADAGGREVAQAYDEPIELAVYGASGQELYHDWRRVPAGDASLTLVLEGGSERPARVALDPGQLLIDRNVADNSRQISP
ncbi:ABC transporter permease [Duganella sp. sic0402]|uniref:ABC transporter permease/M1 family aminopeptidase n=1 Tax=Duganella sp. sic0402 TaxID=2854786 RepID=UPI001C471FCB|nr:M1 family aminopeptidase [Duganella sp. sic0402]MBV7537651.1 ABC transporter permease [Duganella sp. sic0402]